MKLSRLIITAALLMVPLLGAKPSFAVTLTEFEIQVMGLPETLGSSFLRPNELNPELMFAITRYAPPGLYIGVGTERAFMATASNPQISEGVFVDANAGVVLYNRINIKLLRMAQNAADYTWLRGMAQYKQIADRAESVGLTLKEFTWFKQIVRDGDQDHRGDIMAADRIVISSKTNYVINSRLAERLIEMAKQNRLSAYRLNWRVEKEIHAFKKLIGDKPISIIDASNAWWNTYIGLEYLRKFIAIVEPAGSGSSLTLLSHLNQSRRELGRRWEYIGLQSDDTRDDRRWEQIRKALIPAEYDIGSVEVRIKNEIYGTIVKTEAVLGERSCQSLFVPATPGAG